MRTPGLGDRRFSSTSGVLPIARTMSPYFPPQGRFSRPGGCITSESVAVRSRAKHVVSASVLLSSSGPQRPPTHGGEQLPMSHLAKTTTLGLLALLLMAVPASAAPDATASRVCSTDGIERKLGASYVTALSTRRVSCPDARSFSRLYHRCRRERGGRDGRCPRVRRFRCSERRFNVIRISYDSRVLCTRGSQRIRMT